jgi:hypothetical protein
MAIAYWMLGGAISNKAGAILDCSGDWQANYIED